MNVNPTISQTLGFLGAGKMATALAGGMIRAGLVGVEHVAAADVVPAALTSFVKATGARSVTSNTELVRHSDIVILAVKPQQIPELLEEIGPTVTDAKLIVSIAAGVKLKTLESLLPQGSRIVRVMPNTPCLVGAGASAYSLGTSATADDAQNVERLLATVGCVEQVPEKLLDAVTGLSGSGPAFVYQIIEALSDGGVKAGLPRPIATKLAAQTVLGAAQMVLETGEHPGHLKDAVTSPGGTTIAGLHELERGGLRGILMNAVESAARRSSELG